MDYVGVLANAHENIAGCQITMDEVTRVDVCQAIYL
jgi:hypothetical protein